MNRWIWICLLSLLLPCTAKAINALVSYNTFYVNEHDTLKPYLELYWQIEPHTLKFSQDDTKQWTAGILTTLSVSNDKGILVHKEFVLSSYPAANKEQAMRQNITDLHRFLLPAGKIKIQMQLSDAGNPENMFTYTDSVVLTKAQDDVFFSDIQMLDTSVYSNDGKNAFYKNGKLQIPLSTNFLDDHRDILHYYGELYKADVLRDSIIIRHVYISKKEVGVPVAGMIRTDTLRRRDKMLPMAGSINIEMLPSGNYYLVALLENIDRTQLATQHLFFQRLNTVPVVAQKDAVAADTGIQKINVFDLSKTFAGKYTPPQLMAILKMITPIATPLEQENIKGFLNKPDETYMRYFVYNFWTDRNKENPQKEWELYADNVKEVNKLFGHSVKAGYETERGIVYLKYGKPQLRITVNNETGALPYEIWQYNTTGSRSIPGVFLFYRPGYMISDYTLLHSNVPGELRNTAWREFLYLSGSSAAKTSNFRAEEYIRQ